MKKNIFILCFTFLVNSAFAVPKTNPDISVNILLLGKKNLSEENHKEEEEHEKHEESDHDGEHENQTREHQRHGLNEGFSIQEVEVYFKSNIDPYWSGNVSLGLSQHKSEFEIDLEEAYIESLFIPSLTLKAGKFYAFFGRHNHLHTHYYPFIDPPLVNHKIFGFHGWNSSGLSLAYLSPLPWYSEVIAQGFYTHNEKMSGVLFFKNFWDLNDSFTLELDLSYGTGFKTFTNLYNASLVWKWNAIDSDKKRDLSWTIEYLHANAKRASEDVGGFSSYMQWPFLQSWWLEGRAEYLYHKEWDHLETQKYSFLVSFVATEYSAIRLQYDVAKSNHGEWEHSVAIQSNVSLGTHPAHLY